MSKNEKRLVRDPHQKKIVELFSRFDGSKNRRKIFEDFITVSAISISNAVDKTHSEEREKRYLHMSEYFQHVLFQMGLRSMHSSRCCKAKQQRR